MPLARKCSRDAFEANLRELIRSGRYTREQAIAIAMDVLQEACHEEGKPMPKTKAMITKNQRGEDE